MLGKQQVQDPRWQELVPDLQLEAFRQHIGQQIQGMMTAVNALHTQCIITQKEVKNPEVREWLKNKLLLCAAEFEEER